MTVAAVLNEAAWRTLSAVAMNRAWGLNHGPRLMRRFAWWLLPTIGSLAYRPPKDEA